MTNYYNFIAGYGLNDLFEVACNLEKLEVVEPTSVAFKSSSDSLQLSPDVYKRFRVPVSRDVRSFEVSEHEVEFGVHEEIHTFTDRSNGPIGAQLFT